MLVRLMLAERRPVHDFDTSRAMLANADVMVTGEYLWGLVREAVPSAR